MRKPEIRFFNPETDKISDFKLILLLSDKLKIYDKDIKEYIDNVDGKCVLIKYEEEDKKQRTQVEYTHQIYIDEQCKKNYKFINKDVTNLGILKKIIQYIIRISQLIELIIFSPFENVIEFLMRLLKSKNIITFYNYGEYDPDGKKIDSSQGLLFYTSRLSDKQKESMKIILKKLKEEGYDIDKAIIPRKDKLNLEKPFKGREKTLCYEENLVTSNISDFEMALSKYDESR